MSLLPINEKRDALQPNEQEVDIEAAWRRVRGWIYAALGMVLVIAIAFAIHYRSKTAEEQTEIAAQTMLVEATTAAAIQSLIEKYPSSDAAVQGLLLLGYQNFQEGNWKSAREQYQQAYERAAALRVDLAASGLFGVGASYEAEKSYDKSIEAYALLASRFPNSFKAVEAKMGEARVYELKGEIDKARKAYDNIIVTYPRSEWKNKAEQRKKIIASRVK